MVEKRQLVAIDGRPRTAAHVLLWVDVRPVKRREGGDGLSVRATGRRAWPILAGNGPIQLFQPRPFEGPDSLAALLPAQAPPRRGLTVWLCRGWEDFVLTGLAELTDRGLYRYQWLTLDGQRVIGRGALGKRRVDLTSLAAWTGGEWDSWRDDCQSVYSRLYSDGTGDQVIEALDVASPGERAALGQCLTVLEGCRDLLLGPTKLSIGAQARSWWCAWGGPRCGTQRPGAGARGGKAGPRKRCIVAPIPRRPKAAAAGESHCCQGLIREQYARGHVAGPVHVLDLQSAYLRALTCVNVPSLFERAIHQPTVPELRRALVGAAGCALVRLSDCTYPFAVRHHARPVRALGNYWCWLTEPDLTHALHLGAVAECRTAYKWRHLRNTRPAIEQLLGLAPELKAHGLTHLAALWRQLYASCVGGFAARSWEWIDVKGREAPHRWYTWTQEDEQTGETVYYRSVAGRVQRRVYRGETPYSLPLMYGTCTAYVRRAVDNIRERLPAGSVLALASDALWLTQHGWIAFRDLQVREPKGLDRWRKKDTFDDAWLDGKGGAVVRQGRYLFPLLPGIPAGVCLDAEGLATWPRAQEWDTATDVRPDRPLPRRRARWDGGKLVRENDCQLRPVDPFVRLRQGRFAERLLLPYQPGQARPAGVE